ncbi:MAG TPA: metalloregulator ArsR/SmtB family transcription factor [Candidatus Binatia bacterium]|jgi:ArsR family transcriptional regulator|nr:metalloregulator ArsR/SmtB family transcription factor [Candidatus Binatia bacterium]
MHPVKMNRSAERALLGTLANKARLNILFALIGGEKNVTELAAMFGLPQPLVSHNLQRLTRSGFVSVRRAGNFHYYALNARVAAPFLQAIDPTLRTRKQKGVWLRAILTQTPVVIVAFDLDGLITFVSGDTVPRFGLPSHKLLGRSLHELSARGGFAEDRAALRGRTIERTTRSGKRSFDVVTVPYKDERGRIIGGISVTIDAARRARAEVALSKTVAEWRALAEGSPDLIATIDRDGVFLVANREIMGRTREDVVGTILYDYLPAAVRKEAGAKLRGVFRTGREEHFRAGGMGRTSLAQGLFECRIVARRDGGKVVSVTFTARSVGGKKK